MGHITIGSNATQNKRIKKLFAKEISELEKVREKSRPQLTHSFLKYCSQTSQY